MSEQLYTILSAKSTLELKDYVTNMQEYTPDSVEVAMTILKERGEEVEKLLRTAQVNICKTCQHHQQNNLDLICNLTNRTADFIGLCAQHRENKLSTESQRKNNIFSFRGRATRTEYWLVTIITNIVALPANSDADMTPLFALLYFAVLLVMIWMYFATLVRRCHNRGKAWWFMLIPLYYFLLYFLPGQEGDNKFGLNPRDKKN